MKDQAPDDIFALYSRFDLDGEHYRVFPKPEPAGTAPTVNRAALAPPEIPEPVLTGAGRAQSAPLALLPERSTATETIGARKTWPVLPTPDGEGSRMALRNLSRSMAAGREPYHEKTAASLAAASISVHGAAGGVGSTTIAAVLTRLLAKAGRRCAIFDETEDSTLPIFFGAQRISDDHRRFSGLHSLFEPRIQILTSAMFESKVVESKVFEPAKPEAATGPNFIERNFAEAAAEFDHLIFDHPARSAGDMGAGLTLYVAIPDLSSLVGTRKLKKKLEASGAASNCLCVLNRFDAASALHQEVLGWYRENFQDVAVIRHSPLIPEALAEGTTVMDWAPDADISSDFVNLFAVVSRLLGPELERFKLCS